VRPNAPPEEVLDVPIATPHAYLARRQMLT